MTDDIKEIKAVLSDASGKQKAMIADLLEDALEGGMDLSYSEIAECIEWLRNQA